METHNNIQYNKYVPIILPSILFLFPYAFSFMKFLSLSYITVLIFTVLLFLDGIRSNRKINVTPLILISVLVFISLFSYYNVYIYSGMFVIQDIVKLYVWGLMLALINSKKINVDKLTRNMIRISIAACSYLVIQVIFHYIIGINLPNVFDFGIITHTTTDLRALRNLRPAAFYGEPAYLSSQLLVTLGLLLFSNYECKGKKALIIFFALSNILSTSTAGIYLMLILIFMKLFTNKKAIIKNIFLLFIVSIVLILVSSNIDYILQNLGSVGDTLRYAIEKPQYFESSSRIGGSYSYLGDVDGIQSVLGYGIGNEYVLLGSVTYINSFTRLILQTGYIGFLVYLTYILSLLLKVNNMFVLYILIVYLAKSITGGSMFSITGMYLLSMFYIYQVQGREVFAI